MGNRVSVLRLLTVHTCIFPPSDTYPPGRNALMAAYICIDVAIEETIILATYYRSLIHLDLFGNLGIYMLLLDRPAIEESNTPLIPVYIVCRVTMQIHLSVYSRVIHNLSSLK